MNIGPLPFGRIVFFLTVQASALVIMGLSRAAVFVGFRERFAGTEPAVARRAFRLGTRMDLVASSLLLAPFALLLFGVPASTFAAPGFQIAVTVYLAGLFFILFLAAGAEYYYFEEYGAKFNHIFLEYARPSREVIGMIWKEYSVVLTFGAAGVLTAGTIFLLDPLHNLAVAERASYPGILISLLLLCGWVFAGIRGLRGRPIGINAYEFTNSQLVNQLAANGIFQVFRIWYDERKHGGSVAKIFDKAPADAMERIRAGVATPENGFVEGGANPLDRIVANPPAPRRFNVVFVLMESHAASHVGVLGAEKGVTPYFDALSREGLLFTRMYASGDRTARGLEAVLSSFPPLPGMSTLKRSGAHGRMFTAAGAFNREGYRSRFYYGGDAAYDNVRGFMLGAGFESVFEQRDIANPSFQTSWGVCDEDLYDQLLKDLVAQPAGSPCFSFLLTISNHRPYVWPENKIEPLFPDERMATTFQYADYAMGKFIEKARATPAWENTVFVFVADHGACVHGQSLVPIERFHIPCLILAPGIPELAGKRIDTLCSQIDVLPTLFGILGGERRHCCFGRDLRHLEPSRGAALMHYYGSYAFARDGKVAILAPEHAPRVFEYDSSSPGGAVGKSQLPHDAQLVNDALALLSVGEKLYKAGTYQYPNA